MATRVLLRTLIPRSFSGSTYLLRFRPDFSIAAASVRQSSLPATNVRSFSTRRTTSSLNDSNPNWSNRLPKDTIILEARWMIYSVSTRCYYAFGANVSEHSANVIKELPGVRWVLPDSYLDVKNKDYGGTYHPVTWGPPPSNIRYGGWLSM